MNTNLTLKELLASTLDTPTKTVDVDSTVLALLDMSVDYSSKDENELEAELNKVLVVVGELQLLNELHIGFLTLETAEKEERLTKISALTGSAYTEESATTFIKEARRVVVQIISKLLDVASRWIAAWANGTNLRLRALSKALDMLRLKLNAGQKDVTVMGTRQTGMVRSLFNDADASISVGNGTQTLDTLVALAQVIDSSYTAVLKRAGDATEYREGLTQVIKVIADNATLKVGDYNLFTLTRNLPIGISALAGMDKESDFLVLPGIVEVERLRVEIDPEIISLALEIDTIENMIKVVEKYVALYGGSKSALAVVKAASAAIEKCEDEEMIKLINADVTRYVEYIKVVSGAITTVTSDAIALVRPQIS